MSAKRRQRRSAAQWGELLRSFDEEKETAAEFCVREGVSTVSFYRWRTRLAGQSNEVGRSERRPHAAASLSGRTADFVDLGPLAPNTSTDPVGTSASLLLRLELGRGVVLQISRP